MWRVPERIIVAGLPALVECWTNNGKMFDQYTVIYRTEAGNVGLDMSHNALSPQGVCMHFTPSPGTEYGTPIAFADLPDACRTAVRRDLEDEARLVGFNRKGEA